MSLAARPNVILILSDDHGAWAMGCAGNAEIRTPTLDRLATEGTRFSEFFCVSPVCSPARASLLTGRIPSQHGVHDWLRAGNSTIENPGRLTEYLSGQRGYTDVLAAHGYVCGLSGKWHLGDSHHPQKGFTFWEAHALGGGDYYGAPLIRNGQVYNEPRYVTDAITDNALRFLDQHAGGPAPFYLSVHYTAPHSPWGRANHPAEIYEDYYRNCPFLSTPQEPPHPWQIESAPLPRDDESRRAILSGYYAAVTAMDANIARLLACLEARGLNEDTLVIYSGDNGMNMGHHGIYGKGNGTFPQNMFDTSVKVPFILRRPGHVPAGRVSTAMLSHYDFMPTLLEYLDLENPEQDRLPGRSFAPLLEGREGPGRDCVVVYDEYGPVRMVRTDRWKYVHRYPYGPHELYDLAADPGERVNLADQARHREIMREMRCRLEDWFIRYVDPRRDGRTEAVTGKGQIGWAGPAAKGEPSYATDVHYAPSGRTPPALGGPLP